MSNDIQNTYIFDRSPESMCSRTSTAFQHLRAIWNICQRLLPLKVAYWQLLRQTCACKVQVWVILDKTTYLWEWKIYDKVNLVSVGKPKSLSHSAWCSLAKFCPKAIWLLLCICFKNYNRSIRWPVTQRSTCKYFIRKHDRRMEMHWPCQRAGSVNNSWWCRILHQVSCHILMDLVQQLSL